MSDSQLIHYYGISWRDFAMRVAALTVLLYDHVLTFEDETKPWTVATYLFLWCRYAGIVMLLYVSFLILFGPEISNVRYDYFLVESWMGAFSLWAVELMLQLRLYALYNCSRRVAVVVGSVFFVYASAFVGVTSFASYNHFGKLEGYFLAGELYCRPSSPFRGTGFSYWIIVACFEDFVLGLTIYKGYQSRHRGNVPVLADIYPTLLRDTVLYLLLTGFVYMTNAILNIVDLDDNLGAFSGFGFVMPIVMGSRITINIRKVCDKHGNSPASPSQVSLNLLPCLNEPGQYV
ncbi:hypothetical protein F5887DRAFT_982326 [Amanita rubescens]|nr:hypothetical protein F5887DRAFT_982326 [Amanita rubescens]